jgi:hypothetical protein
MFRLASSQFINIVGKDDVPRTGTLRIGKYSGRPAKKSIFMYRRRILRTLYGAVDFLIVRYKGLYGWGGGGGGNRNVNLNLGAH